MRAEYEGSCFRAEEMFFGCRRELKPRDRAVGKWRLSDPIDGGIPRGELQNYRDAGIYFSQKERTAGRQHQHARSLPRKDLEPRLKARLGGIAHGQPTLSAHQLLICREHPFPDSFSFAGLKKDVDEEQNKRNEEER